MDTSTREGRDAIRSEIHLSWDGADPWGSALSPAFALCEILYWHLGEDVPAEAQFTPGAIEPGFEDYPDAMFVELLDDGIVTADDLVYWTRVLARFTNLVPEDQKY